MSEEKMREEIKDEIRKEMHKAHINYNHYLAIDKKLMFEFGILFGLGLMLTIGTVYALIEGFKIGLNL